MKKLKKILHYNKIYIFLIIVTIIYSLLYINIFPHKSKIDSNLTTFTGLITNIKIDGNLLTLEINDTEKLIGNYYFKTEQEKNSFINSYELGDTININGTLTTPNNNTVPNLFNYKKYLERKNIYHLINIDSYHKVRDNKSLFYNIKNKIINHINTYKSKNYLHTFILGNNDLLDINTQTSYQENGISHLLAISGMHVSLLSGMILFLLKKINLKEKSQYLLTIIFLLFFMFLSGNSASVSRSVILFCLLSINKIFNLEVKTLNVFIVVFCILVNINPNILFDVGFQFSFTISFYLILLQDKLKENSYFKSLLRVSMISFLVSLPISIYYFYQVNILSIIYNLLFVPLVSIIIFPLSVITLFIPLLDDVLLLLIDIMEQLSLLCNQIPISKMIFMKPNLLWIITYYIFLSLSFNGKKVGIVLCVLLVFIQYFYIMIFPKAYFLMIDVGQGDSILIHSSNKTLLIDTGGKISYKKENWQQRETKSIATSTLIPLFKSLGIKSIDYLVLTHGDYDHMGEAINLVDNFKVDKVIFNNGEYNELELGLIKVLEDKNVPYFQNIKELNIDNNKLYFLNGRKYDNENDNSNVIYTKLNKIKILLMGDAGVEVEQDLTRKYDLTNIDILKVGHHGSKTSTSYEFINEISPKYSIISVGKNNRYGHPNKEVLDNLENSKIYRTDQDGSIMFKIKNNELKIETCSP